MTPSPCPFCGHELVPTHSRDGQEVVGYHHRYDHDNPPCLMSGRHIGANLMTQWEGRQHSELRMDVVDDHPVFSFHRGRPVEVEMVNATLAYYRNQKG